MKIFLSHAAEQAEVAAGIALSLRGDGHDVFFDRSSLPAGATYDDQIRDAIAGSDLVVFVVSPEAVAPGRYTLTELELAEAKWPHPAGHVLPVVVSPTDLRRVPAYVKAVTLLEPRGNVPAAVAAAVSRAGEGRWQRLTRAWLPATALVITALGVASWWLYRDWQERRATATLVATAHLQAEAGRFPSAWEQYARAARLRPREAAVVEGREALAMAWLDNIRVTAGQETFTDIVERVEDVLVACASNGDAVRAADCRAHLGWADFLRSRDGHGDVDPVAHYRRALERDPANVYAHAMWGFEILRSGGAPTAAREQFAKALATGRERRYVRRLQVAGLLWRRDDEAEEELVRVANEMRLQARGAGEAPPADDRWRLWNVYWSRLVAGHASDAFLGAVPAADHLATFEWLFPADEIPGDKRHAYAFTLATLQEHAGDPRALATFTSLHAALVRAGALASGGPLPERTEAALRRLGGQATRRRAR